MSGSGNQSRLSKRPLIVIDANNSIHGPPAAKRGAEPVLSEEALEIQQRVAKLDKDKQNEIRLLKGRVEFLEKLVELKPAPVDDSDNKKLAEELQEKVNSLTKQLDEEKSSAKEDRARYRAKIAELNSQRAEVTSQLNEAGDSDKRLVKELQNTIDGLREHRNNLLRKLAEGDGGESKLKEQQKRINELTRKLKQYEGGQQPQQQQQGPKPPRQPLVAVQQQPAKVQVQKAVKTAIGASTGDSSLATAGGTGNSPNIFDVHFTKGSDSIAHRQAHAALLDIATKAEASFGDRGEELQERRKEVLKGEKLHCAVCNNVFEKKPLLTHLFSTVHQKKVVESGRTAYVSRVAYDYWMHKLESMVKQPTAANDGESSNEDEEEEEGEEEEDGEEVEASDLARKCAEIKEEEHEE